MALYDSAALLVLFNRYANRPATSDPLSDADKYARLTDGQNRVVAQMMARCPKSLYSHASTLPTMTSVAGGNIFTFGMDVNGYPIFPMGKAKIFDTPASFPQWPWVEGWDYVTEGNQIRLTNNRTWTAPLYWYGVQQPGTIDGSTQPVLTPEGARELIVYEAVGQYALEGGSRNVDMANAMQALMWEPVIGAYPRWFAVWKTQFSSGGALGSITGLKLTEAGGGLHYSSRIG